MIKQKFIYEKLDIILLRLIFTVFKLLGLGPFCLDIMKDMGRMREPTIVYFTKSRIGSIYNMILSLCFALFIYLGAPIIYNDEHLTRTSLVFTIVLFIGCSSMNINIFIIYVLRQRELVKILNELVYVDEKFIIKSMSNTGRENRKCHLISIIVIITYIIAVFLLFITQLNETRGGIVYNLVLISEFCLAWSMIQYAIVLIYLKKKFNILNKSLELLVNFTDNNQDNSIYFLPTQYNTIVIVFCHIRTAHRFLYNISCKISDFYAWPVLMVTLYACVGTMYSSYHFVTTGIIKVKSLTFLQLINSILWIVHPAYPLMILTNSVTRLIIEVCLNYLTFFNYLIFFIYKFL